MINATRNDKRWSLFTENPMSLRGYNSYSHCLVARVIMYM